MGNSDFATIVPVRHDIWLSCVYFVGVVCQADLPDNVTALLRSMFARRWTQIHGLGIDHVPHARRYMIMFEHYRT